MLGLHTHTPQPTQHAPSPIYTPLGHLRWYSPSRGLQGPPQTSSVQVPRTGLGIWMFNPHALAPGLLI